MMEQDTLIPDCATYVKLFPCVQVTEDRCSLVSLHCFPIGVLCQSLYPAGRFAIHGGRPLVRISLQHTIHSTAGLNKPGEKLGCWGIQVLHR